ncbi:MAG TPA: AraC family transcriptional regulator, partial [Polyangiaceae bacterium]|nr:AraC family transcriptional regulator [Polyangiaceae bacterium]
GWTGDGEHPSEVAVFHCQSVPEPLASLPGGWLRVALDAAEVDSLRRMATELEPEVWSPTLKGELHVSRAVAQLCLIALKGTPNRPLLEGGARQRAIVQAATIWYGEHLSAGPTLEQIARAVHVSTSHLRRLFHRVRRRSPRRVLDDVRFERARALLADSELSLEAIAEACGYSDASALSRGFRRRRGKPPGAWRRKT